MSILTRQKCGSCSQSSGDISWTMRGMRYDTMNPSSHILGIHLPLLLKKITLVPLEWEDSIVLISTIIPCSNDVKASLWSFFRSYIATTTLPFLPISSYIRHRDESITTSRGRWYHSVCCWFQFFQWHVSSGFRQSWIATYFFSTVTVNCNEFLRNIVEWFAFAFSMVFN